MTDENDESGDGYRPQDRLRPPELKPEPLRCLHPSCPRHKMTDIEVAHRIAALAASITQMAHALDDQIEECARLEVILHTHNIPH